MADINSVCLSGWLNQDSYIKSFSNGETVCTFSVAVTYKRKSGGSWINETAFIRVVLYGKQADDLQTYLIKGAKVGVTGELHQTKWINKNGLHMQGVEVIARFVQILHSPYSDENKEGQKANFIPYSESSIKNNDIVLKENDVPF